MALMSIVIKMPSVLENHELVCLPKIFVLLAINKIRIIKGGAKTPLSMAA